MGLLRMCKELPVGIGLAIHVNVREQNAGVMFAERDGDSAFGVLDVWGTYSGGAQVRFAKIASCLGLVLFSAGIVCADGIDGHVRLGGGGGGSPSCDSFQATTDGSGLINGHCAVTGEAATTIEFAILDQNSNGGLSCGAPDLTAINWTGSPVTTSVMNGATVDQCSFTAPTTISRGAYLHSISQDGSPRINDGDCDLDDFLLGIPVGCDVNFTTSSPNQLFAENSLFDVSANNSPLATLTPEPQSLSLLLLGLAVLPLVRRKFAR